MNTPYQFRLMACLPQSTPVELYRSTSASERLTGKLWESWTRDLSESWLCWAETPMADKDTITARPGTKRVLATCSHERIHHHKNEAAREARGRLYATREL